MKRFKRQSDLVKQAIKNVCERQDKEYKQMLAAVKDKAGDFLQQCAAKLRMPS